MSFLLNYFKSFIQTMLQFLSFSKKKLTNSVSIYIKSSTGSTISVDLNPKWDIKNVKEIVAPQLGLNPEELKIIFAGKELSDNTMISECDLGEQSILHAVKSNKSKLSKPVISKLIEELETDDEKGSKPLCETLLDLQLSPEERNSVPKDSKLSRKAHFYVYCGICKSMQVGKLRVRCELCKSGAFVVDSDPQCWDDVILPKKITGYCESWNNENNEKDNIHPDIVYAQFYFKCTNHISKGEQDQVVPLDLIKPNLYKVPCIACTDISDPVFVFPCESKHCICLPCFKQYAGLRLLERQFWPHQTYGYTLNCPANCENSFIKETHHFRLLTQVQYNHYQRYATEEYVLSQGGVLCPQPGCGMGILLDDRRCDRVTCGSCGYSWSLNSNQNGLNLLSDNLLAGQTFNVQLNNIQQGRWGVNSNLESIKPCPNCGVPTERDGGCMHMICSRGSCKFQWCWICSGPWSRECMASHWF